LVLSHDPGNWPIHISDRERQILIKRGPVQLTNEQFPINEEGRRFTADNYRRRLCNGEDILRVWVIYSRTQDSIFCFSVASLVLFEFLCLQVQDFQTGNTCLNFYLNMRNQ
jgi:hypothetical protein